MTLMASAFAMLLMLLTLIWWWAHRMERRRDEVWRKAAATYKATWFENDTELYHCIGSLLPGQPVRWRVGPGLRLTHDERQVAIFDLGFTVPYAHGHKSYRQTAVWVGDITSQLTPFDVVPIGLDFRMRSKEDIESVREGLPRIFWERYVLDAPDLDRVKQVLNDDFFQFFDDTWRQHCHYHKQWGVLWFERDVLWPADKFDQALERAGELAQGIETMTDKTRAQPR